MASSDNFFRLFDFCGLFNHEPPALGRQTSQAVNPQTRLNSSNIAAVFVRPEPVPSRDYILTKRKGIDGKPEKSQNSGMENNPKIKLFNSAEFAKEILWRLARNHADTLDNKMMLIEVLSRQTGKTAKEILESRKDACDKKAEELYFQSLKVVGFQPESDSIQGGGPRQ